MYMCVSSLKHLNSCDMNQLNGGMVTPKQSGLQLR